MNTVYQRILHYEQANPRFKFHQQGIAIVGYHTRNEWLRHGGRLDQLYPVQSIERNGTFMVFEYPTAFVPIIDEVIIKYVQRVISKGINKRNNEKPAASKQQNQNNSVPTSSPPNRKRKRIPVDRPAKPAFSGRNLKK